MNTRLCSVALMAATVTLFACGGSSGDAAPASTPTATEKTVPAPQALKPQPLFFSANDGNNGIELWISDGSAANTRMLKNISASGSSSPTRPVRLGDKWLFSANDIIHGRELWITDGTEEGTKLLKDIRTDGQSSSPRYLTLFKGKIYFAATTVAEGNELWVSDGTAEGTKLHKDLEAGVASSSPTQFTVAGDSLFFNANTTAHGQDLWYTDGTKTDALDLLLGTQGSGSSSLTALGNKLVLSAIGNTANGSELMMVDGTTRSASLLKDIYPGSTSSSPSNLIVSGTNNDKLFFTARTATEGRELWVTDGTTVNTKLLRDLVNGSGDANFDNRMISFKDKLYFSVSTGRNQYLWESDGSVAGTSSVFFEPAGNANILGATQELIYFSAYNNTDGRELWVSDGSNKGTKLLKNIVTGNGSPNISIELSIFNGKAYFRADDKVHGSEPWISDGTESGTQLFKDINPDASGSTPTFKLPSAILNP